MGFGLKLFAMLMEIDLLGTEEKGVAGEGVRWCGKATVWVTSGIHRNVWTYRSTLGSLGDLKTSCCIPSLFV